MSAAEHAAAPTAPAAVAARGLQLVRGRHPVLGGATFTVPSASVTSLVGPNGAGKSTLLDAVVGLLAASAGELTVLGTSPLEARRRVGYVLQAARVNDQLPITVREAVAMGRFAERGLLGRSRAADREAVDEALDRLELVDLRGRHLHELSGGQRQRVFVAQGLAQRADLLLLDEPVAGLDIVSRQRILEVVDAERAAGRTVVMTTHDLSEAAGTDHVLLLAGRIVAEGAPDDTLTATNLAEAYGGRLLRLGGETVLLDDPHHHAHGHDHTVCATDDELR